MLSFLFGMTLCKVKTWQKKYNVEFFLCRKYLNTVQVALCALSMLLKHLKKQKFERLANIQAATFSVTEIEIKIWTH